jgi:hypothetical protein
MLLNNLLFGIAFVGVVWGVVSSLIITDALQKRGVKINWIFLKIMIIKYVAQYKEMTRTETGRTGPWYYSFILSMNVALVAAVIGLILTFT